MIKNGNKLVILCCMVLLTALLTGCGPFALGQMLGQTIGGSDGPTSVIVSDGSNKENLDGEVWYMVDQEEIFWIFGEEDATLYNSATNYFVADYEIYYDDEAVEYIADELSEYGLTAEEQYQSIDNYYTDYEHYFCIVFSNAEMYDNGEYVGGSDFDMVPYCGYILDRDGMYYYDMIGMNSASPRYFYSYQ